MTDLENEGLKLTDYLKGKVVKIVRRHRSNEILIEFDDGTRLFIDQASDGLEFSIQGSFSK